MNSPSRPHRYLVFLCLALWTATSVAAPDRNRGQSPETRFKVRYHRWVAALYDRPGTLLISDSSAYIDFPEFDAIVELGKPALPSIAKEIEAKSDMALYLYAAILKITGWTANDFNSGSVEDLNAALIQRLRSEKLIPNAAK